MLIIIVGAVMYSTGNMVLSMAENWVSRPVVRVRR